MNIDYFKEKIEEELEDSKDYIKRAIEIKAMSPAWAKTLYNMSADELTHATNLYKMFSEYIAKLSASYKELPTYIDDANYDVTEMFTECSAKIKSMHEMYDL